MATLLVDVFTSTIEVELTYGSPAVEVDVILGDPVVDVITTGYTGPTGPEGPQGPPGDPAVAMTKLCQGAIGGDRVVKLLPDGTHIAYASNDDLESLRLSVGLSETAGADEEEITVITRGEWTAAGWAWSAGDPVFLSTNGLLTQTPPVSPAFMRVIGVAINATSMFVNPEPPILLA